MKNTMISHIFQQGILKGILAILLLFGTAPNIALGQEIYDFLQVTDRHEFDDLKPDIEGDWITFEGNYSQSGNHNAEIFVYHIPTDELTNITGHLLPAERWGPRIEWPWVVWVDNRNGPKHAYAYNLETNAEYDLTPNVVGSQNYIDISGDKVVWVDHHPQGEFRKLMMYDLTLHVSMEVPNVETFFPKKGVRIDGDDIVFETYINREGWQLVHYSLADESPPRQITHFPNNASEENKSYEPEVHDGRMIWVTERIIWGQQGGSKTYHLYLYDLTEDTLEEITSEIKVTQTNFTQKLGYDIHENLIVWSDRRDSEPTEGNWNIYAYDLTSGTEHRITENHTAQLVPSVYNNLIVAEDYRDGVCAGCVNNFDNANIYAYYYQPPFLRGDANNDGHVDISDPSFILNYLYQAGDVPECLDAADANDDGFIDQSDATFLNTFMYNAGEAPPAPFPNKGVDPTDDNLTCFENQGGGGGFVEPEFLRGDVDGDGEVAEADHYVLYGYVYAGDDSPPCMDAADINDDGVVDSTDWSDLIYYLFLQYDTIAEPFPSPGVDPTPDTLTCEY